MLDRRASPDDVRRSVHTLRDAGFDNISLDLVYGIPGQGPSDLGRDLTDALALEPQHLSCYELEAKPGTRFTHAHGEELARQAEAMEGYFEQVVGTLTGAGYRWYETANFCLDGARAGGRDLRAGHNLAYWQGRDYLGLGVGAVSTIDGVRTRNLPRPRALRRRALGGLTPSARDGAARRRDAVARAADARAAPRRSRRRWPTSSGASTAARWRDSSTSGSSRSARTGAARSCVSRGAAASSAAA